MKREFNREKRINEMKERLTKITETQERNAREIARLKKEQNEIKALIYMKVNNINGTITMVGEKGFEYMLTDGHCYYSPYLF